MRCIDIGQSGEVDRDRLSRAPREPLGRPITDPFQDGHLNQGMAEGPPPPPPPLHNPPGSKHRLICMC